MAGTRHVIAYDDQPTRDHLAALQRKGQNLQPLFADFGEYLLLSWRQRWEREEDPEGLPWEPLNPKYAKRKAKEKPNAGILIFDAFMINLAYDATGEALEVGTDRIQGASHQFGDEERGIPQREFLGTSDDDDQELLDIAAEWLADVTR